MALAESGVILRAEGSDAFNNALERAERSVQQFGQQAGGATGGLERMSVATVALGTALGNLAGQAINAATNALTNFISTGWNYSRSIENAEAQLLAFTGSQEEAARVLAMVERRAAQTPFAFDEMASSAAGLQAVANSTGISLEELLETAEILAASNPAEGLEGAAFALREFFSGDMISLQDRFNLPKDMLKRVKEGGMSLADLRGEMDALGLSTSLVTNLAGTLDGRWSTLSDTFTRAAGKFVDPIFNAISESIFGLQGTLDQNMPQIEARLAGAGQFVADAITSFRQGWEGNWVDSDIIQPLHRVAGTLGINVRTALDNVSGAMGTWNQLAETAQGIWETEWLQKAVIQPLTWLGGYLMADIQSDWQMLTRIWEEVSRSGEAFNRMAVAAGTLIRELITNAGIFRTALFGASGGQDSLNSAMGSGATLGETLVGVFDRITGALYWVIERILEARMAFLELIKLAGQALAIVSNAMSGIQQGIDLAAQQVQGGIDIITGGGGTAPKGGGGTEKAVAPLPPPPVSGGGRSGVVINGVSVVVPANASPTTATKIVSDGITQALRSQGLA